MCDAQNAASIEVLKVASELIKKTMDLVNVFQQGILNQQVAFNNAFLPTLLSNSMLVRQNTVINNEPTTQATAVPVNLVAPTSEQKESAEGEEEIIDVSGSNASFSSVSQFMSEVSSVVPSNISISYSPDGSEDGAEPEPVPEQREELKKCTKCSRKFKSSRLMDQHLRKDHRKIIKFKRRGYDSL